MVTNSKQCKYRIVVAKVVVVAVFIFMWIWYFDSNYIERMSNPLACQTSGPNYFKYDGEWRFYIRTTWDGKCLDRADDQPQEPVGLSLSPHGDQGVKLKIVAPFFGSPDRPDGPPGKPFNKLWDYEVVEAFFLNDEGQYLESEFGPYGHHLLLMLNGERNMVKDKLELTTYWTQISGNRWRGEVVIPFSYFPPGVTRFNAYAIHGEGENRKYESLYPADDTITQPDFHQLKFFKALDFSQIVPDYDPKFVSDLWKPYVKK